MAFSVRLHSSSNFLLNPPPSISSSSFFYFSQNPQTQFFPYIKPLKFTTFCTHNSTEQIDTDVPKKKRKPRPSFYEQIRDKWSVKPISQTKKFPWQLDEQEQKIQSEMVGNHQKANTISGSESFNLFVQVKAEEFDEQKLKNRNAVSEVVSSSFVDNSRNFSSVDKKNKFTDTQFGKIDENVRNDVNNYDVVKFNGDLGRISGFDELIQSKGSLKVGVAKGRVREDRLGLNRSRNVVDGRESLNDEKKIENLVREIGANRLPWMAKAGDSNEDEERRKRSKTELAERTIPEHELQRLRNVALRMKERIKVGAGGVTQAVVDAVHEKWQIDEVVKLRFEGPSAFHMKRIHETLESKTGGVVIWRSGSSVVLYRGLTYKLGCVHTYIKEKSVASDVLPHVEDTALDSVGSQKSLTSEELMEMSELDKLLDTLGPRYVDWSGRPPFPVDADLLPGMVPGYRTPFRLLPHRVRPTLKDSETTTFRRQARNMPPHFALGRNRELQGLAAAIVKLWENNAIAKIAIKRGVLNTRNERMAEELKRLTGGTLLSRNKEFIVLYRGNDFIPPPVSESLKERERLTLLQYEEEEGRRNASALINIKSRNRRAPMVAGTLAETAAATSRWGKQPSNEDVNKMLKDSAVARHASLISYLQKKFAIAKGKLKKAEKALQKVHEYLEPEQLPTDLETITDEERLVFRRMGLSMKSHLLLGRREVFAGTVENIHMHWKYRELVKIVVKGKNFAQVKHIAIFLEAETGGLLVSIDKTTIGYTIIIYRGKNYKQPIRLKPRNLLTRRQALARSIELQRREGLKHHISSLEEQMELVKSELKDLKDEKELDDKTFYEILDDEFIQSDDESEEDEDEEAYLQTYDSGDEGNI